MKVELGRQWRELKASIRWPSRLEWRIARRYLRSRRNSRTASLNTVISTGGVAVGVTVVRDADVVLLLEPGLGWERALRLALRCSTAPRGPSASGT